MVLVDSYNFHGHFEYVPSGNQTWLVGKSPMNGGWKLGKSLN